MREFIEKNNKYLESMREKLFMARILHGQEEQKEEVKEELISRLEKCGYVKEREEENFVTYAKGNTVFTLDNISIDFFSGIFQCGFFYEDICFDNEPNIIYIGLNGYRCDLNCEGWSKEERLKHYEEDKALMLKEREEGLL